MEMETPTRRKPAWHGETMACAPAALNLPGRGAGARQHAPDDVGDVGQAGELDRIAALPPGAAPPAPPSSPRSSGPAIAGPRSLAVRENALKVCYAMCATRRARW